MRKIFSSIIMFLLFVPFVASAIWQVAEPTHEAKFRHSLTPRFGKIADYPQKYYNGSRYLLKLRKGRLKVNVFRMARKYNWRVVWQVANNYFVMLNTDIVGPTFPVAMNRLLKHYPLYARYDRKNHIMVVSFSRK